LHRLAREVTIDYGKDTQNLKKVVFKTKQVLAKQMLERAFIAGVKPGWVTADAFYGSDTKFGRFLEESEQAFIVAVRKTAHVASRLT
jgi:SRSO17 transposase